MPPKYDPMDPATWSGADRIDFLGTLGFTWISGNGENAIWEAPNGERMNESAALYAGQRGMVPQAPRGGSQPQGDTSAQVDGAGVAYVIRGGRGYTLDGEQYTPVPVQPRGTGGLTYEQQMTLKQTPSSSYSVSQSIADPRTLAIQQKQLEESIRKSMMDEAIDQEKLTLEWDKVRVLEEDKKYARAHDAQVLAESVQSRLDTNRRSREQMQNDLNLLVQKQAFDAEQGLMDSATRLYGQDVERESRERLASQEDATRRAGQAAEFAGNGATDFGKLGAFLGNGGISGLSTAMGQGQTAITDQSLEPLGALLQPAAPVQPAGSLSSYISMLKGLGFGQRPNQNPAVPPPAVPMAGAGGAASSPSPGAAIPNTDAQGNLVAPGGQAPQWQPTPGFQDGGAVVDPQSMNGLMQMAQMLGMQPKAIAGERGKANGETVYSNGDVVVMPDRGMGMGQQMPKMQEGGGVFGSLSPAWQYINKAGSTALKRANLTRPLSPVELSDPGTDPEMQELGASLAALTRGIPRRSYLNELMRITPQGMQQGFARRTY